jgi:hypothetical protein
MSAPLPKNEEETNEEYVPTTVLERFEKLENILTNTQQRVKIWQDTTSLTGTVVFVAALALVFTVIFFFIQAIYSDINSRYELTKSVQELKATIEARENR